MTVTGQPTLTSQDYQDYPMNQMTGEVTAVNCTYCGDGMWFQPAANSVIADTNIRPAVHDSYEECPNLPGPETDPHWVEPQHG
jgi:hypothetical protein